MRRTLLPLLLLLALARPGAAIDLHVDAASGDDARDGRSWPAAVRSIGRAIELTLLTPEADTVHVTEGRYVERLVLDRDGITLLGGYPSGGGARDPSAHPTVVDGSAAGPVVTISRAGGNEVVRAVTLDGFELVNGSSFQRGDSTFGGGGVFIEDAEVLLTNNVIRDNAVTGTRGGGVYLFRLQAGPSVLRANRILENLAEDGLGGGIAINDRADPSAAAPILLEDNVVRGNRAVAVTDRLPSVDGEPNGHGGGLWLWGGAPVLRGNRIEGNTAESLVGTSLNGQGGGLFVLDGSPVISNNVVEGNRAMATSGSFGAVGGGLYVLSTAEATSSGPRITDNEVRSNTVTGGEGRNQAAGAGIALALLGPAGPLLSNNVIEANTATGGGAGSARGGGVYAYVMTGSGATLALDGDRMESNAAEAAGGGIYVVSPDTGQVVMDGVTVRSNAADFASGVLAFGRIDIRHARINANRTYDPDGDEVSEIRDTCPGLFDPVQADADGDGLGDACDDDDDDDGLEDAADTCPLVANPGGEDACSGDRDGDGVVDGADNCPSVANPDQGDATADGVGDACEPARFDPLETNASGIWVVGDSTLTNVEITDNRGQGLQVVGFAADPTQGLPELPSSPVITNATIAGNLAAGFITYLADGTVFRDSIVALNVLSDGFDTERPDGTASSPNMTCDGVYFWDGVASLPCTGSGNLDFSDGDAYFAPGPLGDYYLADTSAGQAQRFVAVDAGTRPAAGSAVEGLTTRTDEAPDAGTVDLGFHHPVASSDPGDDPLAAALRLARVDGEVTARLAGGAGQAAVRYFRGQLTSLGAGYTHATPFTGIAGDPECSVPAGDPLPDPGALDGVDHYYLAVTLTGGAEGSFGADSLGSPRTRPEDSPTDPVTTCP